MDQIIKTTAGLCPYCGHVCDEVKSDLYPKYDSKQGLFTKLMLCENCMKHFYERYTVTYAGCVIFDDNDLVEYDAEGKRL